MDIKFYRPHNPINSAKNRFKTTKSSDAKHKLPHFQTMKQPFKAEFEYVTEKDDYKTRYTENASKTIKQNLVKASVLSVNGRGGI